MLYYTGYYLYFNRLFVLYLYIYIIFYSNININNLYNNPTNHFLNSIKRESA